jgi:hypothetical protein
MAYTTKDFLKRARTHIENNLLTQARTALIFASINAKKNNETESKEFETLQTMLASASDTNGYVEHDPAAAECVLGALNRAILTAEMVQQSELAHESTPI